MVLAHHDTYDRRVQLEASRHRRKDAEFLQQSARWNGATLPQRIKTQLFQAMSIKDLEVKIQIKRNAFAWPPAAQTQQQVWLSRTADWITQYWDVPSPVTVDELYYPVPYNPSIITLESLFAEVPTAILDPYIPVADCISASLPERNSGG